MNKKTENKIRHIWTDNFNKSFFENTSNAIYQRVMEAIHENKALDMTVTCGIKALDQISKLPTFDAKTSHLTVAGKIIVICHLNYNVEPWDILVSSYTTKTT